MFYNYRIYTIARNPRKQRIVGRRSYTNRKLLYMKYSVTDILELQISPDTKSRKDLVWLKFALEELTGIQLSASSTILTPYFIALAHEMNIPMRQVAYFVYGTRRSRINNKVLKGCLEKKRLCNLFVLTEAFAVIEPMIHGHVETKA